MTDNAVVMVMTKGIGANLTNDEKRAHLIDLKRERIQVRHRSSTMLHPSR
jgi:hypothetical protein